jgi:hypothetical protein
VRSCAGRPGALCLYSGMGHAASVAVVVAGVGLVSEMGAWGGPGGLVVRVVLRVEMVVALPERRLLFIASEVLVRVSGSSSPSSCVGGSVVCRRRRRLGSRWDCRWWCQQPELLHCLAALSLRHARSLHSHLLSSMQTWLDAWDVSNGLNGWSGRSGRVGLNGVECQVFKLLFAACSPVVGE